MNKLLAAVLAMTLMGCNAPDGDVGTKEISAPVEYHFSLPATKAEALNELGYIHFSFILKEGVPSEPSMTPNGECVISTHDWDGTGDNGWSTHTGYSVYKCLNGEADVSPMQGDYAHAESIWIRPHAGHCVNQSSAGCANLRIRTVDLQSTFWTYLMGYEQFSDEYENATVGYLGHEFAHIVHGYFHDQ